MSSQKNPGHNSKRDFLKNPVEHIDITSFDSRKIISSMEKMSFVSRETANAANIYNEMLKDKDCTIFLTLAGSTSAAGCMNIYKDLVKYNMVDAIVATGATIVDMDFFEALGFASRINNLFSLLFKFVTANCKLINPTTFSLLAINFVQFFTLSRVDVEREMDGKQQAESPE